MTHETTRSVGEPNGQIGEEAMPKNGSRNWKTDITICRNDLEAMIPENQLAIGGQPSSFV